MKNKQTLLNQEINIFNSPEFEGIKNKAGLNSFMMSPKKWIELIKQNIFFEERLVQLKLLLNYSSKKLSDKNA